MVLQPAGPVLALRVVVSPMHDATFVVPFVDPVKFDGIADCQRLDARREVDVVRDEDGVSRGQLQDCLLYTSDAADEL